VAFCQNLAKKGGYFDKKFFCQKMAKGVSFSRGKFFCHFLSIRVNKLVLLWPCFNRIFVGKSVFFDFGEKLPKNGKTGLNIVKFLEKIGKPFNN